MCCVCLEFAVVGVTRKSRLKAHIGRNGTLAKAKPYSMSGDGNNKSGNNYFGATYGASVSYKAVM